METATLPATLALGAVHLTVADLDAAIDFYTRRIGLRLKVRSEGEARLGTRDEDLLVLVARPDARRARGTTGLYHFAILVPSRADLANVLRHLVETRTPLQGASDHLVSEAVYLADPEGNGIEIYRDRPRAEWPLRDGRLRMATDPLDVDGLLAESAGGTWSGLPDGTRMGHVHLHVSRLPETEAFYTGVLGFDLVQRYGGAALFVSAGGYHHHVGLNTWAGEGAPAPPPDSLGLRFFEVRLPDADALAALAARVRESGARAKDVPCGLDVADPSGNHLRFTTPGADSRS